jgi:peroxiredoxin Q/BCP
MRSAVLAALACAAVAPLVLAQNPPAAPAATPAFPPLEVGAPAPDFALAGATRFGTLAAPVRLSDFRGKTVVLAFFARARTRG